jgi:hypothetical protein
MSTPAIVTGPIALTGKICGECGISYAITEGFEAAKRTDGKLWYCPNGHRWFYPQGEAEVDRLKRELAQAEIRARAEAGRRKMAENSSRALRGHITRIKHRIAAGVCPCCRRTFQDLARHMKDQHPDYPDHTSA